MPLITHEGKSVRFFDDLVAGKVVVINFIYTTCPDACPLETATLAEVQKILGERVGQDVFMYSISIDPERDTPEVLAEYAKRYQAGPGWSFLTGNVEDISLLRRKLGLLAAAGETALADHSLSMVIGNQATGRWMKTSPFENPYILASQIGDWLHNWKLPPRGGNEYADAPKLRDLSSGESLFRTRCAVCHVVGVGDGLPRVGPDLRGVTRRREHAWLQRWIAAPDELLAQGDSIALGLFEAFNRVPMPNLRLNETEVQELIDYVEHESQWQDEHEAASTPTAPQAGGQAARACCLKKDNLILQTGAEERDAPDSLARSAPEPAAQVSSWRSLLSGAGFFAVVALLLRRRSRAVPDPC